MNVGNWCKAYGYKQIMDLFRNCISIMNTAPVLNFIFYIKTI